MKKLIIIALSIMYFIQWSTAQTMTQTVKGTVTDRASQEELLGAMIILTGSDPITGTSTGLDGTFTLENVPVGRQNFECRMIGYESEFFTEILVSSGKEVILDINLKEDVTNLDEVVVTYQSDKRKAINEMASVSSRQFTVEETQRYAGGMNDPARLVSSFAGVATPSISSNGISVRGNSPSGLLWRIEGVEVPSPNHFADLNIAGAGLLTALSSQMMGNSDFMTGAFPAEYGNAASGVFDINLRDGNSTKREHTAQIGILGVDFATEGPYKKGSDASYLINYRYSTFALIAPLLPSDAGVLKYQDLSFKTKIPTKTAGTFSLWGIGAYDSINMEDSLDTTNPGEEFAMQNSQTSMYMFASGLNHKINLNSRAFLSSSIAMSGNSLSFKEQKTDPNGVEFPRADAQKNHYKLTLQSSLTSYFGDKHYNRTGFYANNLGYDLDINHTSDDGTVPVNYIKEDGQAMLYQFYTQSQIDLSSKLSLNAGLHSQYFQLNEDLTIEPRISATYKVNPKNSISVAYGLHSRIEPLNYYFIKDDFGNANNKSLKLMKANHLVLSFSTVLSNYLQLKIEPYYQKLNHVPVVPDSYISTLNIEDNLFFNESLISGGTGRNYGIDITLDRHLHNGLYYQLTASLFDSKYTPTDGIERNTRFNKNFVLNAIIGMEWQVGRSNNNTFSANFRLNYLGGNRAEAIDMESSVLDQSVVYGETNEALSFSQKYKDIPIMSFTVSYRKNKPKYSSVWSLQVLNANLAEEFDYNNFNTQTQSIDQIYTSIMIPNLSYKIEF